jgi:hypothetical protein
VVPELAVEQAELERAIGFDVVEDLQPALEDQRAGRIDVDEVPAP